jgi:hypothetical protein
LRKSIASVLGDRTHYVAFRKNACKLAHVITHDKRTNPPLGELPCRLNQSGIAMRCKYFGPFIVKNLFDQHNHRSSMTERDRRICLRGEAQGWPSYPGVYLYDAPLDVRQQGKKYVLLRRVKTSALPFGAASSNHRCLSG